MKLTTLCLLLAGLACSSLGGEKVESLQTAVFGTGCFWCSEAIFERIDGVRSVKAGYAGGTTVNPTYEEVCTGTTGHAEVAEITFDSSKVSYAQLLDIFWKAHDPTSLNRQGADVGTQYRSAIFYLDDRQKTEAEQSKQRAQKMFDKPIVTEIRPLTHFYPAENYHQEYFNNHTTAPYCVFVIRPKLEKLHLK